MSDTPKNNPFVETEDGDPNFIRPTPVARRTSAPAIALRGGGNESQVAARASRRMRRHAAEPSELPAGSGPPLLAAAAPLLQLLARLRNTLTPPDAGDLRDRAAEALRSFEQRAQAEGVPEDHLRPVHYALCATLDDAVLNTPWGSEGGWASQSLVSTFHTEVGGGEQFFALLYRMQQNPAKSLPVLELMHFCLSLGFMGRYRLSPRGRAEIDQLREELYATIAAVRAGAEAELSPAWRGVSASYRPTRIRPPLWVVAAAGLAVVGKLFAWSLVSLNVASDAVYERVVHLPPERMPTIVRTTPVQAVKTEHGEPGALERLRQFLKPEIDAGLVTVIGTQDTPIVRVHQDGMFAFGSAALAKAANLLLTRIGVALKTEPGFVEVVGYTDDQTIRTVRFPSNFQLSAARAAAAGAVVSQAMGDSNRLRTEGRADADPIAPNSTPEGRNANPRIEIVLHRQA